MIALKDVSFSYDGERRVLSDISFEVSKGEWIAVLGHNGSGKSTLIKIMGALLIPSQGACFVHGSRTDSASADVRKHVSFVFQNPESQIVGAVVEDDAAFALENQGIPPADIEERIELALKKVRLLHKRRALSSSLSGGEKQRLALAGAIAAISRKDPAASRASCLILDEPTAMLDPEGIADVESTLRDIHESGVAVVYVTHRLESAAQADRILVLADGGLAWQGGREDFWNEAGALGFELPELMKFKRRLIALGAKIPSDSISDITQAASVILENNNLTDDAPNKCPGAEPQSPPKGLGPFGIPFNMFEISGLSYSFAVATPIENRVLKNVSCIIPRGAWTSVLGRTGSGKSTLVQHLNGLYPIQAGGIFIAAEENPAACGALVQQELLPLPQKGAELRALRRRVGLVFQSPEDQLFSATVREELAFGPQNWGFSEEDTALSIKTVMRDVGLDKGYLERNPLRLSGGERRLVAIASVLAAAPDCIVLDEPTAGLDVHYRARIIELLLRLKKAGKTIVTVTHDFEMAFEHSDRLLLVEVGRLSFEGSTAEALPVLADAENAAVPDMLRVSKLLRDRGVSVSLTWRADEIL